MPTLPSEITSVYRTQRLRSLLGLYTVHAGMSTDLSFLCVLLLCVANYITARTQGEVWNSVCS